MHVPLPDSSPRLLQQLEFIRAIDGLKSVLRRTLLMDASRRENSGEHSWHIAVMAMTLAEYSPEPVNLLRVMGMLLLHDVVEVDAGDTYCYDEQANLDKEDREQAAATRIFNLLPEDSATEFRALWEEFEARESADAKFANALDRFQPLLHNYLTKGELWAEHGVRRAAVEKRMAPVQDGAPRLWEYVQKLLDSACAKGFLLE